MSDHSSAQEEVQRRLSSSSSTSHERRTCWVCFGTDDDGLKPWIRPCKCKGSAKWVHVECLQKWIDEKQKDDPLRDVRCPQCSVKYGIISPEMGLGMKILTLMEKFIQCTCPFLAACFLGGSVYWTAVTSGAVTVMQVLGHKEGLNVMERADPLFLLIGLPAIPIGLIIAKLVKWELAVLRLWRKMPFCKSEAHWAQRNGEELALQENASHARTLVGAMLFPTISTLVGNTIFRSVKSNFQRSLLGGIAFFSMKGILKMYYLQQCLNRRQNRTIRDYSDEP